jgi:D-sedoheptulose 7-phosphate isomerase
MSSALSYEIVSRNIQESIAVKQAILADQTLLDTVTKVGQELARTLQRGGKILFFGNGGSAADAQHLAAELVGRFEKERRALPALALTANTSTLTAIGNDYSYEAVFARQLEGLGSRGDAAVGISTSGKSPNVLSALRSARKMGITAVGMTGQCSPDMAELVDYCISVPSKRTARVQEGHILIGHILCEIIDHNLATDSIP